MLVVIGVIGVVGKGSEARWGPLAASTTGAALAVDGGMHGLRLRHGP